MADKQLLEPLRRQLVDWLVGHAYPLWSQRGIDPRSGGFIEALDQRGTPLFYPRRARVHPRQVYAFAQGPRLGWRGDASGIVSRGVNYFTQYYQRQDGFFRALADPAGAALQDRALLYDQAFALLGYAAAAVALDARQEFETRALLLRDAIASRLAAGDGAFLSDEASTGLRESNPHMHLLEACLAWREIGNDTGWASWVYDLVELALSRFIRKDTGAVGESFTDAWEPTIGDAGRVIEPGHQFEWAWLLLRCEALHPVPLRNTALKLIAIGNEGVRNGVAINALNDDFTPRDANARFWPQTERLKAALLGAQLTDDPEYLLMAHAAATSFLPYLATTVRGLWHDVRHSDGSVSDAPSPASTFYHLVGAIIELHNARLM